MRKALLIISSLLFFDTIVQLYLAGFGTFSEKLLGDESFTPHMLNGQIVMRSLALLAILFAALAKSGKSTVWLTVGIFLLTWVQLIVFIVGGILTGASQENPNLPGAWAVSIHAVSGLLIIFSTYWLFLRARRLDRTGSAVKVRTREPIPASP
jgi:Na+/melibiose symporter-like transporter